MDIPAGLDFEVEYNNRARVPEHPAIIAGWQQLSETYRTAARCELGVAYGSGERNRYDLFYPSGRPDDGGLHLFIHGGYWQGLDRSFFSHCATGLNARGRMVAVCSYSLCPAVRVPDIVAEIRQCVAHLWRRFGRTMTISGHSAGGHLVAEMLSTDWRSVDPGLPAMPISKGVPISGLFDLRPLCGTSINGALGLDDASAKASSPAFRMPTPGTHVTTVVGEIESSEFHRQNVVLAEAWGPLGIPIDHLVVAGANHFTVIAPLADETSALVEACL